jgi:hypothetical protein
MCGLRPLRIVALAGGLIAALPAVAQHQEWQALFDGHSFDGWTQRGGKAEYRVEDGQIVGETRPNTPNSFLCTQRTFADFVLEYEFKIDPKLNSGVQIRSNSVAGYRDGVVHGYQVEIDPTERARTAGIYDESRRGWLADLADNEAARRAFKPNDWNTVRVEALGEVIKTWLNGTPAANLTDGLTHRGFIALQVHSSDSPQPLEVRWRNLRIQDLGDPWLTPRDGGRWLLRETADLENWQPLDKPGERVGWALHTNGAVTDAEGVRMACYLEVAPGAGNIVTREAFGDCRLHVEFMVDENGKQGQANGNSGVYVQSRYEVQILNSASQRPADDNCGGIYKVKAADFNMARSAGEWQSYDIWFTAPRWDAAGKKSSSARMTVYHNGTRIHENVEIPGSTGAGQPEQAPAGGGEARGPLMLQDHGNRIRFRNVWIAPTASE